MINNQYVQVQKATLNDYDITQNIKSITLFNDIDNIGGFSLQIIYNDISDIKGKMPLRGGETIELIMIFDNDENKKFKKDFILINIENNAIDENTNYFKYSCISKQSFFLNVNRDYKTYNQTIYNIISSYIDISCETPDSISKQIIIPGWTKTKAIKYMLGFLDSYFFFETNNTFRFENIDDLLIDSTDIYKLLDTNPKNKKLIQAIKYKKTFDILEESYNGLYNKELITFNPATKSFYTSEIGIQKIQEDSLTLGTAFNFNEDFISNIDKKKEIYPYFNNVFTAKTNSQGLFNKEVELVLHGDINLEVGNTIKLNLNERFNKNISRESGNYLITKIAHHITEKEYTVKLLASKNAPYKDNINNIYKNTIL